jgi:hypothetical protein
MGGLVARIGEMKNAYEFFRGNLKGRDHPEDLCVSRMDLMEMG